MEYPKSNTYPKQLIRSKIMGPNPLKLTEELLGTHPWSEGSLVMDLGSGTGITSVFLAQQYGAHVIATDLWSDPSENMEFFRSMGLGPQQVFPVHADANNLPFAHGTFDALTSIDSYHYFGAEHQFFETHILPFLRSGGSAYLAMPGITQDFHGEYPPVLLRSWTPEQLDTIKDIGYWKNLFQDGNGYRVRTIHEMEGRSELWNDWLECDNPYAEEDRLTMCNGGIEYMNFIAVVIDKE